MRRKSGSLRSKTAGWPSSPPLSRFSTKVWFFPMSLLHHSALTLTHDITFQPYQCSTEIQDKNCCNRWWRKVRSRNKTKARSRTRAPTANIRSSTFFGTKVSGLRNWFWCLQRSFSLTFDAPVIHVPGYILLQFAFLCFIFCKPCQSFRGHVIIKYIILSTGLQKEHFR